ncbi:LysM peptidoglycan-binding domain-containing protein [Kallotenue papyrolyticum]|uniref:LysM peptidoglycan-binding domain-containing protein n=1 Tax=Kallotenue papyrolyticum TaxID=1325125 RepID=UPI000492C15A|nr:LysM domain-containing protein [Kallotenue papyrolyticum]
MTRLTARLTTRGLAALLLPALAACAGTVAGPRPTPQPVIRITPGPTQDLPGTQTALALRSIPTPTPQGLYIVKPGDTLAKIADEFQTTVDEIAALNNIADPNQIEVGQQLIIPTLLTPTAAPDVSATPTP